MREPTLVSGGRRDAVGVRAYGEEIRMSNLKLKVLGTLVAGALMVGAAFAPVAGATTPTGHVSPTPLGEEGPPSW